jgi:nucleoid DNA-binding protein
VTKKELARQLAEANDISSLTVQSIVQAVFDGIIETLVNEGRIELRNFGVFEVIRRKARKARNPRTGEEVFVPAKLAVAFKPGRRMQKKVRRLRKAPRRA